MNQNELMHYGVLGMKWGVRRYQNEDGSYKKNAEGRYNEKHKYNRKNAKAMSRERDAYSMLKNEELSSGKYKKQLNKLEKDMLDFNNVYSRNSSTGVMEKTGVTKSGKAEKAEQSYTELLTKIGKEADSWANSKIEKEYGDYAISDINKYQKQNAVAATTAYLALMGGVAYYTLKN